MKTDMPLLVLSLIVSTIIACWLWVKIKMEEACKDGDLK